MLAYMKNLDFYNGKPVDPELKKEYWQLVKKQAERKLKELEKPAIHRESEKPPAIGFVLTGESSKWLG